MNRPPGAANRPVRATASGPRRSGSAGRIGDLILVAIAHLLVVGSWALTAAAAMGSLDITRRWAMNSEYAFDTGRLPQPWLIPVGIVAIIVAHRFFRWAMRHFSGGVAAYGPSVVAWCGLWVGVTWGAYCWTPPVLEGKQVGPGSGQSTEWTPVGWVAFYSRLALPGLVTVCTAALVLFSRDSPLASLLRPQHPNAQGGLTQGRREVTPRSSATTGRRSRN